MFGKEEWGIIRNISLGHNLTSLVGDGRYGFILEKQCLRNIISNILLKLKAGLIKSVRVWLHKNSIIATCGKKGNRK